MDSSRVHAFFPYKDMKKTISLIALVLGLSVALVGCSSEQPVAEDVNAKIKAMPAEERFKMIRDEKTLSIPQKEVSIDALDASPEQKQKWKEEVRAGGGNMAPDNPVKPGEDAKTGGN
jgi:predicted small secreted protein